MAAEERKRTSKSAHNEFVRSWRECKREGEGGGKDGGRETKRASRGWKGGREKEDREDGGRPRINRSLPCSLPPLGRFPPPRPCSWPFPFVCPFTYQSTRTPATRLHLTPLHLARPPRPADTPFSRCNSQPSIVVLAPTYTRRYAGPDLSTRHTVSLSLSLSFLSFSPWLQWQSVIKISNEKNPCRIYAGRGAYRQTCCGKN